jgi:hypothetical protein
VTDRMPLRIKAAELAERIDANEPGPCRMGLDRRTEEILDAAEEIYAWLIAPLSLDLTAGPVTDQRTGAVAPTSTGDTTMALELGDSQMVTITATPKDAAGQPTSDTVEWTVDNTTAVQPLQVSADTLSVTLLGAVPAATVTLTATDASGNTAPFVFDVVSGPATSLGLTAGPVTDQPAPAPAG